jgi:hypothetical protein
MNQKPIGILGINSDVDVCGCCGKKNLKKVVWLDFEASPAIPYGVNCAARALGFNGHFTSRDANKLQIQYNNRKASQEAFQKACVLAQREADQYGEPVHVIRCQNSKTYYTRREAANNGHLFRFPISVFSPKSINKLNR